MLLYNLFTVLYWGSASLQCLSYCQTEKKMTCICKGNDLEERKEGVSIIPRWNKPWMKELLGPKVLRIAPTVVSLTMSTAEKPISYCSLRGYLALTSCLPMEKRSMTKTAWRQGGDVTPPLKHWTLTVYISRPICKSHKDRNRAVAVYKGMHKQY